MDGDLQVVREHGYSVEQLVEERPALLIGCRLPQMVQVELSEQLGDFIELGGEVVGLVEGDDLSLSLSER